MSTHQVTGGRSLQLTCPDRLWSTVMEVALIGSIAGDGSCRLSLTDEDKNARDLFQKWCREAGCTVKIDQFGNIFGIRSGRHNDRGVILMGSHLDTQPHGGRFDGVLGVLAGLEIIRALNDANIETDLPIAVANWTNEEGVRFKPGLTGSKGFINALDRTAIIAADDTDFFAELKRIGYAGKPIDDLMIIAYYELHIEQGPVLESVNAPVGIVEGIQGVRWFEIAIAGQDAHAGTTPMENRSDSFMTAACIATTLRSKALELDPQIRFTVGRVDVTPNSQNTIPGMTTFSVDLRHSDEGILDAFEKEIGSTVVDLAAVERVRAEVRRTMVVPPVQFDKEMQGKLFTAAQQVGVRPVSLPSGAMHDASSLATVVPTAMLFVQSKGGISHNPLEWSEAQHVGLACEVLAHAVVSHAGTLS